MFLLPTDQIVFSMLAETQLFFTPKICVYV